jgi:hypothetical protein
MAKKNPRYTQFASGWTVNLGVPQMDTVLQRAVELQAVPGELNAA